jgi:molybdate transport repressor ModE-like protein
MSEMLLASCPSRLTLRQEPMLNLEHINEFRKIYVLQTLKEEGSFRQAARKLGVTSSAISQSITSLEKVMGKNLVIRDKSQLRLTSEAEVLLEKSLPAFTTMKQVLGQEKKNFTINRLDLGTYESLAVDLLPGLLAELKKDHKNAKVNLVIGRTSTLLQKLRSGELCTTILIDSEELENVNKELIAEDEFGLFISKNSPYRHDLSTALMELDVGSLSPSHQGHPRYFQKFLNSLDKKIKINLHSDSLEVLRASTALGSIMSILPNRVASRRDDLLDITNLMERSSTERGRHKIVLAYQEKCDDGEAKYLAQLATKIIS